MPFTERALLEAQSKGYQVRNRIVKAETAEDRLEPTIHIEPDIYFTLHDPMFWQKLGEARGWLHPQHFAKWVTEEGTRLIVYYPDSSWSAWMHRYVDHAIENGYNDHQEFFKQFYPLQENHDIH